MFTPSYIGRNEFLLRQANVSAIVTTESEVLEMNTENTSISISTLEIGFGNGNVYCVGEKISIQDIINYFNLRDGHIIIDDFVNRIIYNKIYCCITSFNIKEQLTVLKLNRKLKKVKLYIDFDDYLEALCLVQPGKVSGLLQLSQSDLDEIKADSIWNERFTN